MKVGVYRNVGVAKEDMLQQRYQAVPTKEGLHPVLAGDDLKRWTKSLSVTRLSCRGPVALRHR
jgi:hypothetical protein